jgi:hypothetical protein
VKTVGIERASHGYYWDMHRGHPHLGLSPQKGECLGGRILAEDHGMKYCLVVIKKIAVHEAKIKP